MIGHVRRNVGSITKARSLLGRVFLLSAIVLLLEGMGSTITAVLQLRHAAHAMEAASKHLRHDDLPAATRDVLRARIAASIAVGGFDHPGLRLLSVVPGTRADVGALRSLASVAVVGSEAAGGFLSRLEAIGAGGSGVAGAIYRDGTIDLDALGVLEGSSLEVAIAIADARDLLASSPSPSLGVLRRTMATAERRLAAVSDVVERGQELTRVLPTMVGRDGPRRYLLALQSPSEARGGGGLIGVYGLLSARSGRVTLDEVGPIEALGPRVSPPVQAPDDFSALYGPLSALRDWRQANPSPIFPLTSEVLLSMYERARGERLDGVIALDPIALGQLTRGTGPLEAPGWRKKITLNNARRLLLFRVYKHFVDRERVQNEYLRDLVDELWARFESGDIDPVGLLAGLDNSVRKQHFKIYSSNETEQAALVRIGAAADPRATTGMLQSLFNNNNSGNKLDFFLHRRQEVSIGIDADGTATVTTVVSLTNDVPKKGLRAAARAGVNNRLELGTNRMSLHFLLPRASRLRGFSVDGRRIRAYRGRDGGFPVAWQVVEIPAEETVEVEMTYVVPDALSRDEDGGRFWFTLWPQSTVRPDLYEISIDAPVGYAFVSAEGNSERDITVTGRLDQPYTLSQRVIPTGDGP